MERSAIIGRHVTVYSTSWCGQSKRAMRLLEYLGVPYENIDIDRDDAGEAQVLTWNHGSRSVPTILVKLVLVEPPNHVLDSIVLTPGATFESSLMYITTWCPDCRRSQA